MSKENLARKEIYCKIILQNIISIKLLAYEKIVYYLKICRMQLKSQKVTTKEKMKQAIMLNKKTIHKHLDISVTTFNHDFLKNNYALIKIKTSERNDKKKE